MHSKVLLSHAAMICFSIFVGGSFVISAVLADQISPEFLTLLRFSTSAVLLICLIIYCKNKLAFLIDYWMSLSILALCYVLFFILMFYSLRFTSPTSAAIIFTLLPFISLCLGQLFDRKLSGLRTFLVLALGASGALIVIVRGEPQNLFAFKFNFGDLIMLLGTIFHALYIVLLPKMKIKADPLQITTGVTFYGAILLFFISLRDVDIEAVYNFSIEHWLSFSYLVICASIGTFSLLAFASRNISTTHVSSYTYLIPVWAALVDTFVMTDKIPPYFWIGIIPILICNLLLLKTRAISA